MDESGQSGQSAVEYMLVISVAVVAIVAASITFVPGLQNGVAELGTDVQRILDDGRINGINVGRGGGVISIPGDRTVKHDTGHAPGSRGLGSPSQPAADGTWVNGDGGKFIRDMFPLVVPGAPAPYGIPGDIDPGTIA